MSNKMTAKQWEARAMAYQEAAGHLGLTWTDDDEEAKQGDIVSESLEKMYDYCMSKAADSTDEGER